MYDVWLLRVPVAVHLQSQEHSADLLREMYLVAEQLEEASGEARLPARLVGLVTALSAQYSAFTAGQERRLEDAVVAGRPEIDLHYHVPRAAADSARRLGVLLDEADDFCWQGEHLLTLATPEELVRYRRWFLGEFVAQHADRPPVPWPDFEGA